MKASDIPTKIQLPFGASAGGSYIHAVPVASQIGTTPGAASFTDGYVPLNAQAVALGGVPPDIRDMNGILNAISALSRWYNSGAPVPWDSALSAAISGYPKGTIVQSATTFGTIWVSTVDDNVTNPDTGGAGWESFQTFLGGSLGYSQTVTDVTATRAGGVTYTNSTGKPITVTISSGAGIPCVSSFVCNGVTVVNFGAAGISEFSFVVPVGGTYQVNLQAGSVINLWIELR